MVSEELAVPRVANDVDLTLWPPLHQLTYFYSRRDDSHFSVSLPINLPLLAQD